MKLGFVFAALAAAVISLPSAASAETTIIKKKVYREGPRAEMRIHRHHHHGDYHRPRHRHHHADRTVVIKRQHHY